MENLNYQNGENGKPIGPIIGLIVVIVVIVAGAIYFAIDRSKNSNITLSSQDNNLNENQIPSNTSTSTLETENLEDLSEIESELNGISTTDMDADIENVQ